MLTKQRDWAGHHLAVRGGGKNQVEEITFWYLRQEKKI